MLRDNLLPGRLADYQDQPISWRSLKGMCTHWLATKLGLHRAQAIIADSYYVKWESVHKFGVPDDKIHVVYLAPHTVFYRSRQPKEIEEIRAKYQLPSRYVLGVASFSRTKNTEGLMRVAKFLATERLPPLVLVGAAGVKQWYLQKAKDLQLVPDDTIYMLYNIADEDLACIYRAADLFVNLAWEESFALPVVEAMASGVPVIGTNLTAVPEIIGSGGLTVSPTDEEAVFDLIRSVINDEQLRNELRQRALRRAADFSWSKTAQGVIAV
jgi:glycosyltransferase involved in cell wall biosynthesis